MKNDFIMRVHEFLLAMLTIMQIHWSAIFFYEKCCSFLSMHISSRNIPKDTCKNTIIVLRSKLHSSCQHYNNAIYQQYLKNMLMQAILVVKQRGCKVSLFSICIVFQSGVYLYMLVNSYLDRLIFAVIIVSIVPTVIGYSQYRLYKQYIKQHKTISSPQSLAMHSRYI